MPADFWAGWVLTLTVLSVAGFAWFVFSLYFGGDGNRGDAEDESPRWDGNLREGFHPAPMWWFWLTLASLVFSVVYLMLYPGLGSYAGALRWSEGGRLAQSEAAWQTRFGTVRAEIATSPLAELRADPALMDAATRIFQRHCAACHGDDAGGQANLFPDLTDAEWQWGGDAAAITTTIRNGRVATMVGWGAVLGDNGVRDVADYVRAMAAGTPAEHPGKERYAQFCAACHGADGGGQILLGAPSLADDIYLYGGGAAVDSSIRDGRAGVMPAFGDRLDEAQIRLLVAWLTQPRPAAERLNPERGDRRASGA